MGHNSSAARSGLTSRWFLQPILRISASKENVYDETIVCRERREFHTNSRRYAKHNSLTEVHLWVIFFPFPSPPATTTVVVLSATFFILGQALQNITTMSPFGFRVTNRFCYAFAMFDTRQFETVFTCGRTLGCPQSEPDISLFDIR